MRGDHTDTCKCFTAHSQSLQRLGFSCGRRQFALTHYVHHLEEVSKGICARLSIRPLAKVCGAHQALCRSFHFSETGN